MCWCECVCLCVGVSGCLCSECGSAEWMGYGLGCAVEKFSGRAESFATHRTSAHNHNNNHYNYNNNKNYRIEQQQQHLSGAFARHLWTVSRRRRGQEMR